MKSFFDRIENWQISWDASPATLLLHCLRAEAALRPYLGIGECKAIVSALEKGLGVADKTAFEQMLLQFLAKKSEDEAAVLRAIEQFTKTRTEQLYRQAEAILKESEAIAETPITNEQNNRIDPKNEISNQTDEEKIKREKEEVEQKKREEAQKAAQQSAETTMKLELTLTAAEIATAISDDEADEQEGVTTPAISVPYILTNDYQPITVRQMEQVWRFLRKPSRSNTVNPTPDIPKTVEKMAKQGWLDAPVWQQDKTNKVHLLLIIDHMGSMAAWQSLANQLIQTARNGGGHRQAEVRWMHNLPGNFESAAKPGILFKDPGHLKAEPLGDLLRRCSKQDTEVLVFSDAGAGRGRMNLERAKATEAFVHLLKTQVSSVAWLNPMPPNRWWGNTAELCTFYVQMFETSQRGFMAMINHLRGQS